MRRIAGVLVFSVAVACFWWACGNTPISPTQNAPLPTAFRVSGRVTDSGFPLVGVTVTVSLGGTTIRVTTGIDGSYTFETLAGVVQLQVAADGFTPSTQTVNVTTNTTVNCPLSQRRHPSMSRERGR